MNRGAYLILALLGAVPAAALSATPSVSAGAWHSLALQADGTVRSWGDDSAGALGLGRSLVSASPLSVNGLSGVVAVSAGSSHTLALKSDGTVWAWGANDLGQLGDGSTTSRSLPVRVAGLDGVVQIAAGRSFSAARRGDGTVWTWGSNYVGELGDDGDGRSVARAVPGLTNVADVALGHEHVLARKSDGTLWAWGSNGYGELGDGAPTASYSGRSTPMPVPGLAGVVQASAGGFFSLALLSDGTVRAWGTNDGGQLGDGTKVARSTPVKVAALAGIVEVSAGYAYSLARTGDGRVHAWGSGGYGQIGDGQYEDRPNPFELPQLAGVTRIFAGFLHSFALRADGSLMGWGANSSGQLGDGTTVSQQTPVPIPGLAGIAGVAVGAFYTIAVRRDGTVLTWGDNSQGQLGNGVFTFQAAPQPITSLTGIAAIAAGGLQSVALTADGHVLAWGANTGNQFGDDSLGHSTPVPIPGLSGVAQVSSGYYHSLALLGDGTVRAFGSNYRGRMGIGSEDNPVIGVVKDIFGVRQVSAGGGHSLAVRNDGTVWAWGENGAGQLGDGTTTDRFAPVPVPGLANIVEVVAGSEHSLARAADGTIWAWGRNTEGQLGDGTDVSRSTPNSVRGLRASAIAAGRDFSLALVDGAIWTWGINYNGGLGCSDCNYSRDPVRVPSLANVRKVSAFQFHVLALLADGTVYAWGGGQLGQLGIGTLVDRDDPAVVLREGGTGTVAGNDWFLDLDPAVASSVPADKVPIFLVSTRASGSDLTADIRPRAQDVGAQAGVFVFALAPASAVKSLAVDEFGLRAKAAGAKDTPVPCVLAQLNASGQLVGVTSSNLQPALNTILGAQGQAVSILSNVSTGNLGGATFFVGYGASSSAMIGAGTNRAVATLPGAVQCQPEAPQTGWWWNPAESGRGFSIEKRGSNLFFAAFLYDVSGRSTWYVSAGPVSLDGALYVGDLLSASGGQALGGAYPGRPALKTEGTVTLAFNGASTGTMVWPGGSVPIQRFDIVPNGLATGPASAMPESGWWWNESESGRGFFMEWQGTSLDIAGYMYDEAGNPVWYLTVGDQSADGKTFTGNWWSYGNGQTLTGPYKPNTRLSTTVAPLTITFSGPDAAFMTLPNGRSTALTRHRF